MTLDDLRVSLNDIMGGRWVEIERDDDGEIVIYTGLIEDAEGQLVAIDDIEMAE